MRRTSPLPLLLAGALCATVPLSAAHAQRIEIRKDSRGDVECFRDGRRINCDSIRSERDRAEESARRARELAEEREMRASERARESRLRAEEARRRADDERERTAERVRILRIEAQRTREREIERSRERAREVSREVARQRAEWERAARARTRRYADESRPHVLLGAGADIRRFDDVNRYLATAGVDFRARSGLGMRPEVFFGWTDRERALLPSVVCPACSTAPIQNSTPFEFRSRSKVLGVNMNFTYAFLRGSVIRPYLLGGVGVASTRESRAVIASMVPINGSAAVSQVTYRVDSQDRVDIGLNAGSGLEFGRGPVKLFAEFRYFLADTPSARGFSGMLPITAGLRF